MKTSYWSSSRFRRVRVALITGALLAAGPARGQTRDTLRLVGENGATKTLTSAELAALPQEEVIDSTPATGVVRFRGPTLRALLSLAGAPEGRALRGPNMTLVVLAEARDGYKVAYSLSELDPQLGARAALVAVTQNGQPLSADDGPFRVVVPGETHKARWIRQLTTIKVIRVGG